MLIAPFTNDWMVAARAAHLLGEKISQLESCTKTISKVINKTEATGKFKLQNPLNVGVNSEVKFNAK